MSDHIIIRSERGARSASWQSLSSWTKAFVEPNLLGVLGVCYGLVWLAFVVWHSVPFASLETDGMEYITTAKSLFTPSFTYSSYHGMGFPVAMWLVHLAVPDWFLAAQVVSGIAGLVFVLTSFRLIEKVFDRTSAAWSTVLVITNFFVLTYSGMAMADMLGAALGLLAPFAILTSTKMTRYAWAGVWAGLAAITRYQFFALAAAVVLVWVLEESPRARIKAASLYLGAFTLAVLPLLLLNWSTFGNPLFNSNYTLVGDWVNPSPSAVQINSWGGLASTVISDPKYIVLRYLKKIGFDVPLFLVHVVYYSIFFALPGWLLAAKRRDLWTKLLVLVAFSIPYILATSIGWLVSERYWLYVIPFFTGGAALFVTQLSANRSRVGLGVIALLTLVNLAGVANNLPGVAAEQAPEFKRVGAVIRSQAGVNDVLLVSQPQIGYLADRPDVLFRDVPPTWAALPAVISKYGIRYVEMDDRYGTGHYPDLVKLFDPAAVSQAFPNWQLVYSESKSPRIVVYRVNGK